jgi:predicted amidophosphoribosyltransferase
MFILNQFKQCAVCGSGLRMDATELCFWCWKNAESWIAEGNGVFKLGQGLRVRYSIEWKPSEPPRKVDLIHSLKGQGCRNTWNRLVELSALASDVCFKRPPIWVPIPNHLGIQDDHAYRYAQALKAIYGGDVISLLERPMQRPQKHLNRLGRADIQIKLKESKWLEWLTRKGQVGRPIILVDDVVTTGQTALVAAKSLYGLKQVNEIWVLAYRSSSQTLRNHI